MTLQDLKKLDRAALLRQYEIEVGKPGQAKWATEDVIRKIRQHRDSRPRPVRVNRASLPELLRGRTELQHRFGPVSKYRPASRIRLSVEWRGDTVWFTVLELPRELEPALKVGDSFCDALGLAQVKSLASSYTDSYQHVHLATFWGFHPSGKRSVSRWNPDARSQHKDYRITDPSSGESVIVSRSTAFRRKSENPSLQIEPCPPLLAGEFSSTGDTNAG